MSRYCLDTSAYSFFQRGGPRVVEILDQADWLGMPAATLGELETGFLLGSRRRENQATLREFLANPVVEVVAADHVIARSFARIVVALRKAGTPVPTNDVWIAASALATHSEVLTYDPHFERMAEVQAVVLRDTRTSTRSW